LPYLVARLVVPSGCGLERRHRQEEVVHASEVLVEV
jgi:hypothetical protein